MWKWEVLTTGVRSSTHKPSNLHNFCTRNSNETYSGALEPPAIYRPNEHHLEPQKNYTNSICVRGLWSAPSRSFRSIYRIWILRFEIRSGKPSQIRFRDRKHVAPVRGTPSNWCLRRFLGVISGERSGMFQFKVQMGSHLSIILSLLVLSVFSKSLEAIGLGFPAKYWASITWFSNSTGFICN